MERLELGIDVYGDAEGDNLDKKSGGVAGLPCLRTVGGFDNCVGGMALLQPWCLKWQLSCDSGGLTILVLQLQRY